MSINFIIDCFIGLWNMYVKMFDVTFFFWLEYHWFSSVVFHPFALTVVVLEYVYFKTFLNLAFYIMSFFVSMLSIGLFMRNK